MTEEERLPLLKLKYQLLRFPVEQTLKVASLSCNQQLLKQLKQLVEQEPAFFLLTNDLLPNVRDRLSDMRFQQLERSLWPTVNELLREYNRLDFQNLYSQLAMLKIYANQTLIDRYFDENYYLTALEMFGLLTNDYVFQKSIEERKMENIRLDYIDLLSSNYLLHHFPTWCQKHTPAFEQLSQKINLVEQQGTFKYSSDQYIAYLKKTKQNIYEKTSVR